MHFSLFHATGSLTTHLFENFEQFNVYTHNTVPVSCTVNRICWLLFLHCALRYNYATWTNEVHTFQINTLIQFLTPSTCFEPSWEWSMRFKTYRQCQKLKNLIKVLIWKVSISLSSCIRTFRHYDFPCLILIILLFDGSCQGIKGTCPSDLAIVLSGRHNTHLVTLSNMSVAH